MATKVAVVTGANKGIGFAIVRGLCKRYNGVVYLTSRNIERGQKAITDLEKEGLNPKYHQLDVTDKQSLEKFRDYIKNKYEGIDILVNNAGIAFGRNSTEPVAVQAEQTMLGNYFALVTTSEILNPILKNGARVVNISSSYAHLSKIPSLALREKLKDEKLTVPELSKLMQQFVDAAKQGTHAADWGNSSLVVAKVGVTALSNIHQRILNSRARAQRAQRAASAPPRPAGARPPRTRRAAAGAPAPPPAAPPPAAAPPGCSGCRRLGNRTSRLGGNNIIGGM